MSVNSETRRQEGKKGVIAFFMVVIGVLLFWLWPSSSEPNPNASKNHLKVAAYRHTKDYVKGQLKSPASADFPNILKVQFFELNDSTIKVSSYVDADNSFGAALRNNFTCTVRFLPNGQRIVEEFYFF